MNTLLKLRKEAGYSCTQVAAKAGVTEATYRRWEAKETLDGVKLEKVKKIADLFDKPVSFFISEK